MNIEHPMTSFQLRQQKWQIAYLARPEFADKVGKDARAVQFLPEHRKANLSPEIADEADALFDHHDDSQRIQWHKFAGHGCSSQACCVNFLLPLASRPEILSRWIDHVAGVNGAQVMPIEVRHGRQQLIAFEWFPPEVDYLNESRGGAKPRGANSTSVDAAVKFKLGDETRLLLIEWKYIEKYGDRRAKDHALGDATRVKRYANIWKRPHGPLRSDVEIGDLADYFLDPWYQLLRQQMLAYHAETDPLSDYDHVSLVHISPAGNEKLKRINGDRFRHYAKDRGIDGNLFDVFRDMIAPEWRGRFIVWSTEDAFLPIAAEPHMQWLKGRYPDLFDEEAAK